MPKISIALSNRNDGYNDKYFNNLKRLEYFFKNVRRSLEGIDYEILLLDFNPPEDKPLLSECFPVKKYPHINHVVFPKEKIIKFIDSHYRAGTKILNYVKYKKKWIKKEINYKIIYNFNMIWLLASSLSIKYSQGEYILLATGDTYFHHSFKDFIEKLEPNVLYKARHYINRKYKGEKIKQQIKLILQLYKSLSIGKDVSKKYFNNINFRYRTKICNGTGEFILMDKKSWRDCGFLLPLPFKRLDNSDIQMIFNAVAMGKQIQYVDFPVYNLRSVISNNDKKSSNYNCIVKYKGLEYNHHKEIGSDSMNIKGEIFSKFVKWSLSNGWDEEDISKKYFIELNYKERFEEIKKIFSFLDKEFLLWE